MIRTTLDLEKFSETEDSTIELKQKGGENRGVLTSRGGVGCYRTIPSAAMQSCPARQVCGLTR
jgi:hypothetical protein